MDLPIDFATLRLIWWALLGVLLIGFSLTDGFDLGVGALLPFVAKTDEERRMVINTVGATWEGNQVWFILGGGAIFAAWPFVYAVSFSGFYLAMFLVLSALILRPVSFKYRSKRPSPKWRSFWDWCLFIGGFVPALVFGVAVGNVLLGAPFRLDSDLRSFYDGNLLGLFTPFSLIAGLLSVAMLVLHGAAWLSVKAERDRCWNAPVCSAPSPAFWLWSYSRRAACIWPSATSAIGSWGTWTSRASPTRCAPRSRPRPAPGWTTTRSIRG